MLQMLRALGKLVGFGRPEEKSARGMAIRNVSIGDSGGDLARPTRSTSGRAT